MTHRTMKANRTSRECGFTLVELLVVISIMALLMAILLPALSKAKGVAQTAVCLANVRMLGIGTMTYVASNNEVLPPCRLGTDIDVVGATGISRDVFDFLGRGEYLSGIDPVDGKTATAELPRGRNVLICPNVIIGRGWDKSSASNYASDGKNTIWPTGAKDTDDVVQTIWSSYASNGSTSRMWDNNAAPSGQTNGPALPFEGDGNSAILRAKISKRRLSQAPNLADLVLFMDGMAWHSAQIGFMDRIAGRHKDRTLTNYVMADGHAATMERASMPLVNDYDGTPIRFPFFMDTGHAPTP